MIGKIRMKKMSRKDTETGGWRGQKKGPTHSVPSLALAISRGPPFMGARGSSWTWRIGLYLMREDYSTCERVASSGMDE